MKLEKIYGRLISIPLILIIFALGASGLLNLSNNNLNLMTNTLLLISTIILLIIGTKYLYTRIKKTILYSFPLFLVIIQNLFINGTHEIIKNSEDYDLMNDVSFVLIIPSLLVFIQIVGWIFDKIKNNVAQQKLSSMPIK